MTKTAELVAGRLLWMLVTSRPEIREVHAAYVGTQAFLVLGDSKKKLEGQLAAIRAGCTLNPAEEELATRIQASIDSLSLSPTP